MAVAHRQRGEVVVEVGVCYLGVRLIGERDGIGVAIHGVGESPRVLGGEAGRAVGEAHGHHWSYQIFAVGRAAEGGGGTIFATGAVRSTFTKAVRVREAVLPSASVTSRLMS